MNAVFAIRKPWSDYILSGDKPYEFRGEKASHLNVGDTIFIYESKNNNGCGMIVGEVTIEEIVTVTASRHGPDKYFIREFALHEGNQKVLEAIKKIGDFTLSNYAPSTIFEFMFCDEILDDVIKKNKFPEEIFNPFYLYQHPNVLQQLEDAKRFLRACSNWLNCLGFYNSYGLTYYETVYKLKNPVRYETPIEITAFTKKDFKNFTRAPQSWAYTSSTSQNNNI